MPRSAPGPWTARPSTSTRPSVGRVSPATSRRIVDLPHPDVPTRTANSRSLTSKLIPSSAVTVSPRRVRKRMVRWSSFKRAIGSPGLRGPREKPPVEVLEALVGDEAEEPDDHDPEEDAVGEEAAHRVQDHVAEPLVGGDQLRDYQVRP